MHIGPRHGFTLIEVVLALLLAGAIFVVAGQALVSVMRAVTDEGRVTSVGSAIGNNDAASGYALAPARSQGALALSMLGQVRADFAAATWLAVTDRVESSSFGGVGNQIAVDSANLPDTSIFTDPSGFRAYMSLPANGYVFDNTVSGFQIFAFSDRTSVLAVLSVSWRDDSVYRFYDVSLKRWRSGAFATVFGYNFAEPLTVLAADGLPVSCLQESANGNYVPTASMVVASGSSNARIDVVLPDPTVRFSKDLLALSRRYSTRAELESAGANLLRQSGLKLSLNPTP